MRKIHRLLSLVTAVALSTVPMLSMAETAATEAPAAEATAAPTANPLDVMAIVNGSAITRSTVDGVFNNRTSYYTNAGYDVSSPDAQNVLKAIAIDNAIALQLVQQKAKELGFDQLTEEELKPLQEAAAKQFTSTVDSYVQYYGGLTDKSTEEEKKKARVDAVAALEAMGITEARFLENMKESAVYDKVKTDAVKDVAVTDDEVTAAFEKQAAQDEARYKDNVMAYEFATGYQSQQSYYMPEGYRGVTHILLQADADALKTYQDLSAKLEEKQSAEDDATATEGEKATEATATEGEKATEATATDLPTEEPVTQERVDEAEAAVLASVQDKIDEINQKLASGTSFEDLIDEYGTDPGMKDEATKAVGYSVHQDSMRYDPAFVRAAFSVDKIGDIAKPAVGQYGIYIVKYLRDVPAGKVPLTDEIRDTIRTKLLNDKQAETFNAALNAWKDAAEITYSDEATALMNQLNNKQKEADAAETEAAAEATANP